MRYPQILVYEPDGQLAHQLRRARQQAGQEREAALREPRRIESCLRLLRRGLPSVLVVKIGPDLERELTLVERTGWLFPDARVVAVGDAENPVVARLLWDLGAAYVLFPPQSRALVPALVDRLLNAAAEDARA